MATTHSDKALKTLEDMNTVGSDWKHPAVKWVEEKRMVPGFVTCPTCRGEGRAFYSLENSTKDVADTTVPSYEFKDLEAWHRSVYDFRYVVQKRGLDCVEQDCRTCYRLGKTYRSHWEAMQSMGTVPAIVEKTFMVGYIQWPAGTQFGASRFAYVDGKSPTHCQLCAKGIKKFGRVPLVTIKDGQPRAMFVGADCARKFTGVMPLKLDKTTNPRKHDVILDVNV